MKKYKIGICGFLDRKVGGENGQTLRTVTVVKELENYYGEKQVLKISSHIWKKRPLKFFFQIIKMAAVCKNIIIFPDANGIKVILPIFYCLRPFFRFRLYYNVVGAWLSVFLAKHKIIFKMVSKLNRVFVETNTLKRQLNEIGINNAVIFLNFKQLTPVPIDEAVQSVYSPPYKICFFSRVIPKKGIEDLIDSVKQLHSGGIFYSLDIYGPVDPLYKDRFSAMTTEFPPYINYCGVIDAFKSVDTIKNYYLQVFPTKYLTEGIPGSIVDSLFSGVPVIASRWNSASDVVDENNTGFLYRFGDTGDLKEKLIFAYNNPQTVSEMKIKCLKKSELFCPSEAIKVVLNEINENGS